jgi:hypothetical protein
MVIEFLKQLSMHSMAILHLKGTKIMAESPEFCREPQRKE